MGAHLVAGLALLSWGTRLSGVSLGRTRYTHPSLAWPVPGLWLARSWRPLPGPGPTLAVVEGGWGGHPLNAHLVSGAPCAPWPPRLPIGSRLTLERSEGSALPVLAGGTRAPVPALLTQTAGCCLASPTILSCLRPGRVPCSPGLTGTTLVLISEAQFPGTRLWAQSVTREPEGDTRKRIPGNPCG